MGTATLAIVYGNFSAPAGTVVANILVSFTGATSANNASQTVPPGTASVVQALNPDSYTYSVEAIDASNAVIGTAVTGSFVVPTSGVTVSVPTSVTVTLS